MDNLKSYEQLNESYYDENRLYNRDVIIKRLQKAPAYMKSYISKLPEIRCTDAAGNPMTCTQIPQVVYQYLFGSF